MYPRFIAGFGLARILFQRTLALVVALAVVGASVYAYYHVVHSKCRVPVRYDIGAIDERFGITEDEVRAAITDAESVWEDATGKNLFTFTEGASFKINFVYDERQQNTEKQHALVAVLDRKAEMNESIKADYETLLTSYESLKDGYQARVASYDKRLAAHNAEVERWNEQGGAPEETYRTLNETSAALNRESASLNATAKQLNQLAAQINNVGEKGNEAVRDYNESVESFNDAYDSEDEFTQGDYTGDSIRIYQYDDHDELRRVLAHELGHALSLDHVADDRAIMHHVMEGEHPLLALTYDDLAEYRSVCGTK